MSVAAAFCPQAPLLVPQVAAGAAGELDGLRAACDTAVRFLADVGPVTILGAADRARAYPGGSGSFAAYGVDVPVSFGTGQAAGGARGLPLPLPLLVGGWLAARAGLRVAAAVTVGPDGELPAGYAIGAGAGLLVVGDGSARRGTRAPGGLDPRAGAYDAAVADALAGGDPARLRALDLELGAELLAAGPPAWAAAGTLLAGNPTYEAEMLYDAAPYGVGYLVAAWTESR